MRRTTCLLLLAGLLLSCGGGNQSGPSQTYYTLSVQASPSGGGSVSLSPNQAQHTAGTVVTVTATPASGYTFSHWSGDASGSSATTTVTMNGHKSVTANFTASTAQYTLTVNVSPSGGGTVTKSPNQTTYAAGTVVTLTANVAGGYGFSNWSGDASGTSGTTTVTMTGNKTVTATFSPVQYTLTVNVSPSGAGTVTVSPNQSSYANGTVVTLTANPAAGYLFSSWSGFASGSTNPTTVVMGGGNRAVTANFAPTTTQYTLAVTVSPSGAGSVTVSPNQSSYASGTVVTLTANPASGYQFSNWSGSLTGSTNPTTITMNGNKTVTANFTPTTTQYTLTVSVSPSAGGSVTKSPNQTTYAAGTVVTLTANANSGYSFSSWSGSLTGSTNPTTITMNGNKTVTANFTAAQYTLTVNVSPSAGGSVTKSPNQTTYAAGTVVTLTASANSGYSFSSWSGDAAGSGTQTTVTMNGNKAVTANFAAPANWTPPGISAPSSATAGASYTVTVTYSNWPSLTNGVDRLELEESTSPSSGFTVVSNSTWGGHPSSFPSSFTKSSAATYYYRARVYISYAGTSGYSAYSQVVSVIVSAPTSATVYANTLTTIRTMSEDPSYANTSYPGVADVGPDFTGPMLYAYQLNGFGLKFPSTNITGRSISRAILRLYVLSLRGDFRYTPQIKVAAITNSWTATSLTWNNFRYNTDYTQVLWAPDTGAIPYDIDVTTIVRKWADSSWPNNGIALFPVNYVFLYDVSIGTTTFWPIAGSGSYAPQLLITYQ